MPGSRLRVGARILFLSAALFFGGTASAQTVALPATADTYLRQGSPNQNQGQEVLLHVQQSGHNRMLVAMDSAAIAAAVGSGSLASATLELYVTDSAGWGTAGRTVDLHRITASWSESGATWNCAVDTNPANSQPNCTTQWDGGTFDDEPGDSVLHTNSTSGYLQWNVTDDVRAFLAGTPNYGWLAKLSDETLGGNVDYTSRQGSSTAQRPRLVLVVESPEFDQVPPSISITTPAHPFVINDATPQISVSYADGGSGLALATLDVRVDDVVAVCTAGATSATCEPATLAEGVHSITASVHDQAGNAATATRGFTLLIGPGLRTATFPATADTTLRKGTPNQNYGAEPTLRLRQSGKNRSLVGFDAAEIAQTIGQGTLRSASLELSLGTSSGWGKTGRTVDAHRLSADWSETGATWNCGIDSAPTNSQANCATQWAGGTFQATPTSTVLHRNDMTGAVAFDVTADLAAVVAGGPYSGWLVKKTDETRSGRADYAAREAGAATAPRLVVLFEVPDGGGDTTPPSISIVAPAAAVIYNEASPQIRVEYSDVGSGVNLSSLRVSIDGAVLAGCQAGASAATCQTSGLFAGDHHVVAEIADQQGNLATATRGFETRSDVDAPMVAISRPVGTLYNDPAPVVQVDFTEAETAIDPGSFSLLLDGVEVASACTVDERRALCHLAATAPGHHTIHTVVRDLAGNEGANDGDFTLIEDHTPPNPSITSPLAQALFFGEPAQAVVEFSDDGAGIAAGGLTVTLDGVALTTCAASSSSGNCPLPSLSEGAHSLAVTVVDRAGNVAQAERSFSVAPERQPPVLAIVSPSEPIVRGSRIPAIELAYSDAVSGVDPASLVVRLDETDISGNCQASVASASCVSPVLGTGAHVLRAEIADLRGNRASVSREVEISITLTLTITSPPGGTLVREPTVRLEGTVSPEATSVSVSGVPAQVGAGAWVLPAMPIHEGGNTLTVVARSPEGGVGTATVAVIRDSEAPRVAILTPRDGFVTSASQIVVSGDLVDTVSTSSKQRALKVRVNDHEATVERKSFVLTDLLLLPGENRIEVTAEDEVGNVGRSAITVRFLPDAVARIEEISGNFQVAAIRDTLSQPLVVRIVDFLGRPLAGRTVAFAVTRGDGSLLSFPDAARKLSATTNEEGLAAMRFALGTRAGAGNQEVTVSSVGIPGSVLFCATARPKPAKQVHPIAATDFAGAKTGPAGQPLPKPLFVQVFDGFGNPVAGQEVIFRSVEGGGTFADAPEARLTTDDEGKAGAVFTLGPEEGINNNRVEVNFEGGTESPAEFIVSGLIPGPAELTALAGILLDPSDAPVPGARIHIGSNETRTDAEGRFRLNGVPVGTVHVEIDGSTVTRPGTWPPLGYELVLISGRMNELGKPMRLPQIDDAGKKRVGGDQDVTIPIHGVAGATLTVFAHSVTFPDGSHEGDVAFTQVPAQKVPMIAPQNAGFMLAWTVQPAGVHFDPPARVSIPNFGAPGGGGNPPGLTGEIFSFDHDLGEFVSAGTASITEDGRMMASNPGMGISKAGWGGCPHPPAPPAQGCGAGNCTVCPADGGPPVSRCDACSTCDGSGCKPQEIEGVTPVGEPLPRDETGGSASSRAVYTGQAEGESEPVDAGVGQTVRFSSDRIRGTCRPENVKAEWDFGDGSGKETGRTVEHKFKEEGDHMVTVTLECQCPGGSSSLVGQQAATGRVPTHAHHLIEGHFKLVGAEEMLTPLAMDEDHDGANDLSFRVLGGVRVKLSLVQAAVLNGAESFEWFSFGGAFYDGPDSNAQVLTGEGLRGAMLREVYWEPEATFGLDYDVSVTIRFPNGRQLVTTRNVKTRLLSASANPGDDIRMLTTLLHYMGVAANSHGPSSYGVMGPAVQVQNNFDSGVATGVADVQQRDQIGGGAVGNQTLPKLKRHWDDLFKAYSQPQFAARTINSHDPGFPQWITLASTELQTRYSAAAHAGIAGAVAYDTLMTSWVNKETGMFGHWGFNGDAYRMSLGTYDDEGSMGFSQILNSFKYGSSDLLPDYNLYEPDDAVKGFSHWSVTPGLGAGFVSAFGGGLQETKTFAATEYPRIGQLGVPSPPYTDTTKDLLSKGIMAYNAGTGTVSGMNAPWPIAIKNQGPSGGGLRPRRGVRYSLEIQGPLAGNGVGAGMPLSSWNWVDAMAITTGADKVCNTTPAPGDVSIPTVPTGPNGQVCICPGADGILQTRPAAGNDQLLEFEFLYREQDWLNFDSWQEVRTQSFLAHKPANCP